MEKDNLQSASAALDNAVSIFMEVIKEAKTPAELTEIKDKLSRLTTRADHKCIAQETVEQCLGDRTK